MAETWVTTAELAAAANVSRQLAHRLAKRACEGGPTSWRGAALHAKKLGGQRAAGGTAYAFLLSSLPTDLQDRFNASKSPAQLPLPLAEQDSRELAWWLHYVTPIGALPSGMQRKAAIMELHGRVVPDWRGGTARLNRTTLYQKVKDYDRAGAAGLMRKKRGDAGKARVFVSKKWDGAVPFDDATKAAMGNALKLFIQGAWKGGEPISTVQHLAQLWLRAETEKLGFLPNDPGTFALDRTRINRERHFAKVHRHRFDRKASEDSRWRQQRDASKLVPMEVVVGDVHYMDAPLRLPSGRTVYPRMISFVDVATLRIFSVVVVSESGGSIRVVDMIEAYKAMVTDPSWGNPRTLYLDNGKENGFAPFMQGAAKLAWEEEDGSTFRTLINALPYNAQAKAHVEGRFAKIENHYLKHMQGWAGDDRHNPKVPRLGRRHEPHAQGIPAYFAEFYQWEQVDNTFPVQSGHLAGQSPMERFEAFVRDGWQAVVASEAGFNMAFSERVRVKIARQQFRMDNRFWSNDAIKKQQHDYCWVYRPRYHNFNALVAEDLEGRPLGIAEPNEVVDYLDTKGITNSLEARKLFYEGLRELDRAAPTIDTGRLLVEHARRQSLPAPNPPKAVVKVSLHAEPLLAFSPRPATPEDTKEAKRADYEAWLASSAETMRRLREGQS